jgi:hypothetical protein
MTSETKLREQQDRGATAALILRELDAAFSALERDCFETFKNSDIHDDAGRKTCRLYLKVVEDIRQRFTQAVLTGEAARKELIRLKDHSKLSRMIHG